MQKFAVVWTRTGKPDMRLVCIDDSSYADNEGDAKQAARELLIRLKTTDLQPVEVLSLSEVQLEEMVASDREVQAVEAGEDEVEFLVLRA